MILKREEEQKGTNIHREKREKEQKRKSDWREKGSLYEELACRPMRKEEKIRRIEQNVIF